MVLYFSFWTVTLVGFASAILFNLHFLFIITPILLAFGLMLSALLIREISFEDEYLVLSYHLAGIKKLNFRKPLKNISEISLYGDISYSHLRISYKPTAHVSEPHDEIQSRIYCTDPDAPAVDSGFPFEPGFGKRQFLAHISRILERRGHRLYPISSQSGGRGWIYVIGVDREPELPQGRDTFMIY